MRETTRSWPSTGSAQVVRLGTTSRVIVSHANRDWHGEVTEKLNELTALPCGWDGYNAPAVSFDTAYFAFQMLEGISPAEAPAPQIVPGSHGDLQIEWHTDNGDIELHVRRPYVVDGWFVDAIVGADGVERRFTNDFTDAAGWVEKVTEPTFANAAAA